MTTIRPPGQRLETLPLPFQRLPQPAAAIPEAHGAVGGGAGQQAAIGRKGKSMNTLLMPEEGLRLPALLALIALLPQHHGVA